MSGLRLQAADGFLGCKKFAEVRSLRNGGFQEAKVEARRRPDADQALQSRPRFVSGPGTGTSGRPLSEAPLDLQARVRGSQLCQQGLK